MPVKNLSSKIAPDIKISYRALIACFSNDGCYTNFTTTTNYSFIKKNEKLLCNNETSFCTKSSLLYKYSDLKKNKTIKLQILDLETSASQL
jgi:hypothetical protein